MKAPGGKASGNGQDSHGFFFPLENGPETRALGNFFKNETPPPNPWEILLPLCPGSRVKLVPMPPHSLYTIDCGNGHCSVGLFSEGQLKEVCDFHGSLIPPEAHKQTIYSNVTNRESLPGLDAANFLAGGIFLGMPVHYAETVGTDRLVLAHYIFRGQKTRPTIIVDAGTFITVDIVTRDGFMGGVILPGVSTYMECFSLAQRLPSISKEKLFSLGPSSLGAHTTEEAMVFGQELMLKGFFQESLRSYQSYEIVLTGGWGGKLKNLLPGARVVPHLVHRGLEKAYQQGILS